MIVGGSVLGLIGREVFCESWYRGPSMATNGEPLPPGRDKINVQGVEDVRHPFTPRTDWCVAQRHMVRISPDEDTEREEDLAVRLDALA